MASRKKNAVAKSKDKGAKPKKGLPFHAFWSGALSFGLVNVPVLVFPASRHSGVRLRMLSPEGSLVRRRFFCPREGEGGEEVDSDEIVRGYELEDGSYVTVTDDELEAAEPQKTREIELKQFVELASLRPQLFERGYFLTPEKEATKAYRLLTDVMERTGRAGIATFVMRDREYLVAIYAERGILCAETLRFWDEVRDAERVGLPAVEAAPGARVSAFAKAIEGMSAKGLSAEELTDRDTRRLREIIEKKRKAGRDIVRAGETDQEVESEEDEEEPVDLLETIRSSLRGVSGGRSSGKRRVAARAEASPHGAGGGSRRKRGRAG